MNGDRALSILVTLVVLWLLILAIRRKPKAERSSGITTHLNQPGHYDADTEFPMAVQGESHRNSDGISRQQVIRHCRPGDSVRLVPEPNNSTDPDAVAVFHSMGQIGYVPAHQAGRIKRELDEGRFRGAWILSINGGDEGRASLGVSLRVAKAEQRKRKSKSQKT